MRYVPVLVFCAALFCVGCSDILFGPEPSVSPTAVFDEFWHEFDARYSYFDAFGVNWDSLYHHYRPFITDAMPDSVLGAYLDSLIQPLGDAHISVSGVANGKGFGYHSTVSGRDTTDPFIAKYVSSFYLGASAREAGYGDIMYGMVDDSIGYINISTFYEGKGDYGWHHEFESVLDSMLPMKALIIDIRGNDGGSAAIMGEIFGHFIESDQAVMQFQIRSGPAHSDFTTPEPISFPHVGRTTYTKPIALLTDRGSVSAAEWFTLAMRTLPNVTQIGDTTDGAFSGRLDRELSNGWQYSMSIERITDMNGVSFEGKGIPPDIPIHLVRGVQRSAVDSVLDKAIEILRK